MRYGSGVVERLQPSALQSLLGAGAWIGPAGIGVGLHISQSRLDLLSRQRRIVFQNLLDRRAVTEERGDPVNLNGRAPAIFREVVKLCLRLLACGDIASAARRC